MNGYKLRLSELDGYKIAVALLAVVCAFLAIALINQTQTADRARQACEERNHQHELQTAMSGGRFTWPEEDCH